jgi:protein-disulfide isomerase
MAKVKKDGTKTAYKSKETKSAGSEDVITIELQSLLTPFAVLVGAAMICIAILYGFKKYGVEVDSVNDTNDTKSEVVVDNDTTNAVQDAGTDENGLPYMTASIDDDAIKGDIKTAKVAIVEFSDYECPYCQQFYTTVYDKLVENYIDTGDAVLVFRDLPWLEAHPNSENAANAANCARDQKGDDGYYAFHDELLVSELTGVSDLYDIAAKQKLNASEFKDCVDNEEFMDEVFADRTYANSIGIQGTPGFVIGLLDDDGNVTGVNIRGLASYDAYASVIDSYLAK